MTASIIRSRDSTGVNDFSVYDDEEAQDQGCTLEQAHVVYQKVFQENESNNVSAKLESDRVEEIEIFDSEDYDTGAKSALLSSIGLVFLIALTGWNPVGIGILITSGVLLLISLILKGISVHKEKTSNDTSEEVNDHYTFDEKAFKEKIAAEGFKDFDKRRDSEIVYLSDYDPKVDIEPEPIE